MFYDEDAIKAKMDEIFAERDITGDVAELAAAVCARYLFLNQVMSISTLMEGSFTRCKNVNSAITLAANMFYSVPRGINMRLRIENLVPIKNMTVKQFDIISTYGQYKMCYAQDYVLRSGDITVIEVFMALDSKTYEFQGNDRLVQVTPLENVSQDYYLVSNEPNETLNTDFTRLNTTEQIADLLNDTTGLLVAAITDINYSIRLWKQSGFSSTLTYTLRYLSSTDKNIPPIDPATDITQIPGFTVNENTIKTIVVNPEYPLTDKELIYLFATNKIKSNDVLKTFNGFEQTVQAYFPEFLGFNVVITADTSGSGNPTAITIYYQQNIDPSAPNADIDPIKADAFRQFIKGYYVPNTINFVKAGPVVAGFQDFTMNVTCRNGIAYDRLMDIVSGYQNKIGVMWNAFQMIADIMADDILRPAIVNVTIPTNFLTVGTPAILQNQYPRFTAQNNQNPITINYTVV